MDTIPSDQPETNQNAIVNTETVDNQIIEKPEIIPNADAENPEVEIGDNGQATEIVNEGDVDTDHLINIRIAMLGNVDAGKSTLSGILTSAPGTKDDGRGAIRSRVFNFSHEQKNGRTSSIAHEIMGFDADGKQYVTKLGHQTKKNKIWPEIV
jgi:GTPase